MKRDLRDQCVSHSQRNPAEVLLSLGDHSSISHSYLQAKKRHPSRSTGAKWPRGVPHAKSKVRRQGFGMGKRKPRERLRPTLFQFAKIDAKKKVVNIRTWQTPNQSGVRMRAAVKVAEMRRLAAARHGCRIRDAGSEDGRHACLNSRQVHSNYIFNKSKMSVSYK